MSDHTPVLATIDGRCGCKNCEARTSNIYRMIGGCYNCGAKPLLMLFRAGDQTRVLDCPLCGCWYTVHALRLATPEEIPGVAAALAHAEPRHG